VFTELVSFVEEEDIIEATHVWTTPIGVETLKETRQPQCSR
jgi:hypothetical protein